ncbi:MAG: helix-turn-helix transcriptional regulator [Acidimicrobiales bacterium]
MQHEVAINPNNGRVPLGEALRKARTRVGYGLEAAATAAGLSERELGDYECGIRTPNQAVSEALANIYGVEPERFGNREFVARVPGRYDSDKQILWLGWFRIDFNPATGTNEQLFRSVGAALRSMRSLSETAPVFIRQQEVAILAALLDLADADLAFLIMRYLRLSYAEASNLIERMWAHEINPIEPEPESIPVPPALAGSR